MTDIGIGAGLAAIGFWGFVAVVVVASIWAGIRKREAQHETLRRLMESGQAVDQGLVEKLMSLSGESGEHLDVHLRIGGVVALSAAPGLALLGWLLGLDSEAALRPLLGVAALVACIGAGLLVASRVAGR